MIAVITPISHLNGVKQLIESKDDVVYHEEATKAEVRTLLVEHDIYAILCNPNQQTYKIDKELLQGTKVKLINTCSTGMNHIDVEYCNSNNITIHSLTTDMELINNLPSTAELAFGLMVSLLRQITQCTTHVEGGGWDYTQFMGRQIKDLRIGIVGYGRLGKMMYNYCKAFGAEVMVYDPYVMNIGCSCLEEMLEKSDVISLHVHVNSETTYMINKKILGLMKNNSYIVNTSRGEIVDEQAIIEALDSGKLAGYATDVIEDEFGSISESLIIKAMKRGSNIIITPHVGGMTVEGQTKAYTWAIEKF